MRGFVVVALLAGTAFAGHHRRDTASVTFDPAQTYKVPRGSSPSEGPADAPVTIVEWSDYRCEYCIKVQGTLDQLMRLYPGEIRIVHRALPLDEDDTVGLEAAFAAADQGQFRPMHDRLFGLYGKVDRPTAELVAREIGLDMVKFRADLDAGTYHAAIAADVKDAAALGISGTPMFFVNGRPVHGNQPLAVFADMVDAGLARATDVAKGKPADLYDAIVADGADAANLPKDQDSRNEMAALDSEQVYRMGLGLPGHQLGPDDAPITLVEWSDFACKFCNQESSVISEVHAKYGDQVRIVYRHFPLHRDSELAAEAGVAAAAQGKFWPFADQVWAHFGQLTRGDLEQFAQAAGVDPVPFRAALDDHRYRDVVAAEGAAASAGNFGGTPTLFLDGHPISGALPADRLEKLIDRELARAQAAIAAGIAPRDLYAIEMSAAGGSERVDPAQIPTAAAMHMEPTASERERSVAAACRRRDAGMARALATALTETSRKRLAGVCATEGVDLN